MRGVCDLVLLIDGTGSMGACMEALKSNIKVFVDQLKDPQSPVTDWRARVICYRDHQVDGSQWLTVEPFVSNDYAGFQAQIDKLTPKGGGDEPESLLDALYRTISIETVDVQAPTPDPLKWRQRSAAARVVVVFTDASFHPEMTIEEAQGGRLQDIVNLCHSEKIRLILYAPDLDQYNEMAMIDKSQFDPVSGPPGADGKPDFARGLADLCKDQQRFKKIMEQLAKSVSRSTDVETL